MGIIEVTKGKLVDIVYDLNSQGYTIQSSSLKNDSYILVYRRSISILIQDNEGQKPISRNFFKRFCLIKKIQQFYKIKYHGQTD